MQLSLLGINFIYGMFIFGITIINYYFIKNETILVKLLVTSLFTIDFTIIYLILIYKVNFGIFHFYYLLAFSGGYYLAFIIKSHVKIMTIAKKMIDNCKTR